MKEVRLYKLELTNYRNIDHEVYVFGGENAKIVGENRIGKTNTLEAIYFLLTNYLLDGSSDLTQLKPLADTTRVVSVKGVFDVYETSTPQIPPRQITIEKRYCENWVTKRGTIDRVLDGHTETYFVNDIEQSKAGDYYNLLEEYFGIRNDKKGELDCVQMLCNPLYVGNLGDSKDWTDLRTFIIKLIGNVTDEEVFSQEPVTLSIKEDLEKALGKTEQVKKMYENDIKGLGLAINGYNANINMLEKTSRPTDEEIAIAKKGIEDTQAEINEAQSKIDSDNTTANIEKEVFELKKQVLELNTKEFSEWKSKKTSNPSQETSEVQKRINKLVDEKMSTNDELRMAQRDYDTASFHVENCKAIRLRLVEDYKAIEKEISEVDQHIETVCPTCHRPLEEEQIEEARKQYTAGLQEKLDFIVSEGKANTEKLNTNTELASNYQAKIEALKNSIASIDKDLAKAKEELDSVASQQPTDEAPFVESEKLKDLRASLSASEEKLNTAKEKDSLNRSALAETIAKLKEKLPAFQKVVNDYEYYVREMEALRRVKEEKDDACKKLADLEQKKELLSLFNYTKLRLLDTHVANVFGNIKFQLIRENINGGFDPVCKPYIYDVEKDESTSTIWKSGSKSEKIVTGIAIAEAIKHQLALSSIPILFDEGGEVSSDTLFNRLKTDAQIICVKVEDNINKPAVVKF